MTKAKLRPYINRFTGDVKTISKKEGDKLNEDWARAKIVKNSEGQKVFRFEISSPVKGPDGVIHEGTAVVDLIEMEEAEALDGIGSTK